MAKILLEANTRADDESLPRQDRQDGELIEVDTARFRKEVGIAGIPADFGVIVVRLRVGQEADLVKGLLDSEALTLDLRLRERTPDFKPVRHQVSAQ